MTIYPTYPPEFGTEQYFIRRRVFEYCHRLFDECGFITTSLDNADMVVVIAMPRWDECEHVGRQMQLAMDKGKRVEVVELEEVM